MRSGTLLLTLLAVILVANARLLGHCDTMNGPVVIAAQKALAAGDVTLALIWVQKDDEALVKAAFAAALDVRKLSPEAKELADMYFFETLVRIHRAGEGVAYTGLKPAEAKIEHGIEAADEALEKGSDEELLRHLNEAVHRGIHEQFTAVVAKRNFKEGDVASGREYVKAYVEFIHYAERLFQAASTPAAGHMHEAGQKTMDGDNH